MEILQILSNDILPLLIFIVIGYLIDMKFKLDLNTYNRLTIFVILPSFIFYSIYEFTPTASTGVLVACAAAILIVQGFFAGVLARLFHLRGAPKEIYRTASAMSNAGNVGLVLIVFIFSHPPFVFGEDMPYLAEARSAIIALIIFMNIVANTFGMSLIGHRHGSVKNFFSTLLSMPAVYAVIAAVLVKETGYDMTGLFLWPVLEHFSGALIVFVTITVGIQLHRSRLVKPSAMTLSAVANKLILGPLLAWAAILLWGGFSPVESQVLFIYAAVPSSMTVILYAVEYRNHPGLATQIVMESMIAGLFTMTGAIYLARILFPL